MGEFRLKAKISQRTKRPGTKTRTGDRVRYTLYTRVGSISSTPRTAEKYQNLHPPVNRFSVFTLITVIDQIRCIY